MAYLKFEKKQDLKKSRPLFISFTWPNYASYFSYPKGNFGGNQLPDCSMGLSPLYSTQTSDLHVNIVTRSSARVSSGFDQFKYRSQSFGSQYTDYSLLIKRIPLLWVLLSFRVYTYKCIRLLAYQTPWFVLQDECKFWDICISCKRPDAGPYKFRFSESTLRGINFRYYFTIL